MNNHLFFIFLLFFAGINKQFKAFHKTAKLYCNSWFLRSHLRGGGGGGWFQAFHFGKTIFKLGVGGEGQDTPRKFEGSFGSIRAILPM